MKFIFLICFIRVMSTTSGSQLSFSLSTFHFGGIIPGKFTFQDKGINFSEVGQSEKLLRIKNYLDNDILKYNIIGKIVFSTYVIDIGLTVHDIHIYDRIHEVFTS
jgi:hypothetical protein